MSLNDKELNKIKRWLRSKKGKEAIKKALSQTTEIDKIIKKITEIDPKKLHEPYMMRNG